LLVNKPASLEETPQKVAKRAVNKSIDVANTKLEPIMENNTTKNDLDGSVVYLYEKDKNHDSALRRTDEEQKAGNLVN